MYKSLLSLGLLSLSISVTAQVDIAVQCDNCDYTQQSSLARSTAESSNLYANDVVHVIDMENPNIASYTVFTTVNRRNGETVYRVGQTSTNIDIFNSFFEMTTKIAEASRAQTSTEPDINVWEIDNVCRRGPGGRMPYAESVWDLVGCQQGVNRLNADIIDRLNFEDRVDIKISKFARQLELPVDLNGISEVEVTVSDGATLVFELEYNILSEGILIVGAELNLTKSMDFAGNPLTIVGEVGGSGNDSGSRYFDPNGSVESHIRSAAINAFLEAARRMGIEIAGLGEALPTYCILTATRQYECSP